MKFWRYTPRIDITTYELAKLLEFKWGGGGKTFLQPPSEIARHFVEERIIAKPAPRRWWQLSSG